MVESTNSTDLLRLLRAGGVQRSPRLQRKPNADCRPASNALQRIWFLSQIEGEVATYSVPQSFRVMGRISLDRLDEALTTIAARHEAIRTRLIEQGGMVWQEVLPPMRIRTKRIEARSMAEAIELAHAEAAVPFELGSPPMLRSICVGVGPEESLLMFIFHHAAFDAWSLGVFYSELSALYRSDSLDVSPLPDPPFQYGDYADWQREWLASPAAQVQRTYWREQLGGPLPILRLDYARAAPAVRSNTGAVQRFRLQGGLLERINAVAENHNTTVFVVLLTAFLATLHRYSLQDDIIVGVPVACRSFAETEEIIGDILNTLALRSSISGELQFSELINQTSKTFFNGLTHQELPFDEVVNSVELVRETVSNPVYQAMLVMQNTPIDEVFRLEGVELEDVPIHTGTAKVDLTCSIRSTASAVEGELEYSSEVFNEAGAARFVDAFLNLLSDSTHRPSAKLDELIMLSEEERAALATTANALFEVYPDFQPIHVHFESQARRNPDAIAIEASEGTIRYDELNTRANHLALRLMASWATLESLVGICIDRSIDLVVALLATLKTGAAFIPLDPTFPIERTRTICEDARPLLIITQERHMSMLAALPASLICEEGISAGEEIANPDVSLSPENIAYVYYTSGSTGLPKGVVIEHRCAMNRIEWLRRRYPFSAGDRILHKTPLIFDVAIWEIFGPLIAGATILMADAGAESDVEHIGKLLNTGRTVFAHFVPSMLDAYLNFAPQASYPDLRWVQVSGEAVPTRLLERFGEHFSTEFHNCYGQTETSEVAAWEGTKCEAATGVPIGKQIGVYRLYILDRYLNPVPPGVPGEICVTGEGGLARGYHSRPDLTAQKFVPNPHAVAPGERLYRTGDLARLSEDGVIEYLGRVDNQTKIRGCRVETTEVEAVLASHSSVRACAVVARPDDTGTNQLIAYVVSDQPSASDLRVHTERFLPKYMLPAAYIFIADLPLTPSGKLNRLKLPTPKSSDFEAQVCDEAPQTALEMKLAAMWKQVLGLEKVGRADNFFAIGGNSLKSTQVLVRLKEQFGVQISVRNFFASPTIEGLASLIMQALMDMVTSLSDAEAEQLFEES